MIKIENVVLPSPAQWEAVIRGARNPMNSWDKMDSYSTHIADEDTLETADFEYFIGENDFDLLNRLSKAGTDHRKFMRMIPVIVDITAPMYWWSEYDTYKVGTVANSCSKMHKLLEKAFEMNDFSFDKLPGYKNEIVQFRPYYDYDSEMWKEIEDGYYVSNYGRIKNQKGVIIYGSVHSDGYIFVTIKGKQHPVHRIVANCFCPMVENAEVVNHIDGNKMNNASFNLEWTTQSENVKHSHKNNLQPKGLSTYKGKFSEEQREEIKELYNSGEISKREIARRYGVSHTCINDIISEKYKYIDKVNVFEDVARPIVDKLNELRDLWFIEEDSEKKKHIWYSILQLLPNSYNQKRTVMLNYEVLSNMYHSRKTHKLDEWRTFTDWIEDLPYSELITQNKANKSE